MKTITANLPTKLVVSSLAIAFGATLTLTLWQPANAQGRKRLPEIGWSSRLSSLGIDKAKNVGKTYDFYCQPASEDLIHAPMWGTNVYTPNSGICSTAVHSGMISEAGGIVTIEIVEGQEFYTGSKKNKLESKDHVGTRLSYGFIGEAMVNNSEQPKAAQQHRRSSSIERVMVNSVQRGVERSIERVITDIFN
ncbi:MAG: LCCL domain-containing protein [Cyanobacteria bacterium J06623_7]